MVTMARRSPGSGGRRLLELALDEERDDDCEQRGAFDQRGENEACGLDLTSALRLTSHRLGGLATDAADAETGTDDCDTSTETGAEHRPRARVLARVAGCGLKH